MRVCDDALDEETASVRGGTRRPGGAGVNPHGLPPRDLTLLVGYRKKARARRTPGRQGWSLWQLGPGTVPNA
jgi:hypothetical protein